MSYYTEGYIAGIHAGVTETTIEFNPTPPYLFEDGVKQCLLKSEHNEGLFVNCDEKGRLKVNFLRMDIAVALSLMQSHQRIRMSTSDDDIKASEDGVKVFVEWRTV